MSEDELAKAVALLQDKSVRKFRNAMNFHNAVRALVLELSPGSRARATQKILCVDTSEIVSYVKYGRSAWASFTFGEVFNPEGTGEKVARRREKLLNLDRLISYHLLFGRKRGFVLLSPHVQELAIIRERLAEESSNLDDTLAGEIYRGDLFALSIEQFDRIGAWLQNPLINQAHEFELFKNTFLPGLRTGFVERLERLTKENQRFAFFERKARYSAIAPLNAGKRSFLHYLKYDAIHFPWADFQRFANSKEVQAAFADIVECLTLLISSAERDRDVPRARRERAAQRDARALATVHVLNVFLQRSNIALSVEFVTRAPIIHSALSVMPLDRLDIPVRHPLLLPEIYDFDSNSSQTLGHVYQSVAGALAPLTASRQVGHEVASFLNNAADRLLDALSAITVVQHTLEQDHPAATLGNVIDLGVGDNVTKQNHGELSRSIITLFGRMREALQSQRDPFSLDAINRIADNNFKLIEIKGKALDASRKVHIRHVFIPEGVKGFPYPCVAFRLIGGRIPRLFHCYSEELRGFFAIDVDRPDTEPRVSKPLSSRDILEHAKSTLSSNLAQSKSQASKVAPLETTLLGCIVFASQGQFETAFTLASTVLNRLMRQLRVSSTGLAKFVESANFPEGLDPRVPLALKELFLLRHYCSRAIARQELESQSWPFGALQHRGIQHFDDAERDLYLASRMNAHAEKLARKSDPDTAPGGASWFEDFRFTLASFFSWIDHYGAALSQEAVLEPRLLHQWEATTAQKLWNQHDRWSAAAWAQEIELLAYRIGQRRKRASNSGAQRYFAFAEFSAYHGLLSLFVARLALEPKAEVQVYWNPQIRPMPDKVLAFSEWGRWRKRYAELSKRYKFNARLHTLFDAVFESLDEIDQLSDTGTKKDYQRVVQNCRKRLAAQEGRSGDVSGTFSAKLLDGLLRRLDELATK